MLACAQNRAGHDEQALRVLEAELGIRHLLTRPYRTQTNGKAERFIQTLLVEWAYLRPYATIPNASEPCRDGFASSISSAPTPELGDKPLWAVFVNKFRGNYS